MKIAIVGGTSFIGKNLIKICRKKKDLDITAVIRQASPKRKEIEHFSNVKIVECDMNNYNKLGSLLGKIDCLVYLSWDGTRGIDRNNYQKQHRNYKYSIQAIKSVIEIGCKKIIIAGSQAEYGPWYEDRKLTEVDIEQPNTEYGKFKLDFFYSAKKLCIENNVKIIEPRFFSLYGPNDFEGTMIISMLKNMVNDWSCDLTECKQKWNFLYITDAISGLLKLIKEEHPSGVYNFGYDEVHPLKYYVEEMKRITKSNSKLNYGKITYPSTGIVNINPCVDKLKNIGWNPKINFESGILNILKELKE